MKCSLFRARALRWFAGAVLVIPLVYGPTLDTRAEESSSEEESAKEVLLLEEVTVTGARVEKSLFDTPVGMNVVNQDEIQRKQPLAAAETLRDEPGIWVQKTGHIGGAPIIRGLMGKQILLLVDGVRYNNLNSFSGPNSWTNEIDAMDIERVEVIRGPGSVLYGTDALGGVINIITKRNRDYTEGFRIRPRLQTRYSSADSAKTGRLELRGTSSRFNFLVGGTLKDVGDLRAGGGIGLQVPSSWKERNYDLAGSIKVSELGAVELNYQHLRRYDVTRFDRPGRLSEDNRRLASIGYREQGRSSLLSEIRAQLAWHDREGLSEDTKRISNRFRDTETIQFEAQATSLVGASQRVTYGIHYHHDSASGWRENKKGRSITPNATWDNVGIFVQDELSIGDRIGITPAVRWDTYSLQRDKDETNPDDIGIDQQNSAITGSIGLVVGLTDELNVTATVGRGFRAPNNTEYRSAPSEFTFGINVPTVGTLNPEKSTNYEVGLRLRNERVQGTLSAYYMVITDLIGSKRGTYEGKDWYDWNGDGKRDPDEDVFMRANVGEVYMYGAELAAYVQLTKALSLSGTFTFIDGRNRTDDTPLERAFPTNGTVRLRWREPNSGRVWVEFWSRLVERFDVSRVPEKRLKGDPAYHVDPQDKKSPLIGGDGSVPGYVTLNLRGGARLTDWADFTFGVENLTDKAYRDKDSRIDAPGINFVAGITLRP